MQTVPAAAVPTKMEVYRPPLSKTIFCSCMMMPAVVGQVSRQFLLSNGSNSLYKATWNQCIATKRFWSQITEEGAGTHKPSAFQKRSLVWAKIYPSVSKVPDRVTRTQLRVAMDKFRVRASVIMVVTTFMASLVLALIGRKEREEGKRLKTISSLQRKI